MIWPQRVTTHWPTPCCRSMMPAMSVMLSGTTRCQAQRGSHRALRMPTPKVKPSLAAAHSWTPACMRTWGAHWQSHAWGGTLHIAECWWPPNRPKRDSQGPSGIARLHAACCRMAVPGERTAAICCGQRPALGSGLNPPAPPAGVMGFDSSGGFYLQHSTPRYPDDPVKGAHKSSGEYTGDMPILLLRSTLCICYQDMYSRDSFCT